jgi:hypothetical protein
VVIFNFLIEVILKRLIFIFMLLECLVGFSAANAADVIKTDVKLSAKKFMRGGTFCFLKVTKDHGGWISVIKMVVADPAKKGFYNTAGIHAIQHGRPVNPSDNSGSAFYEEFIGTASIRPDNTERIHKLHIMLVGNDYGVNPNNGPNGIWSDSFVFSLDIESLKGTLFGRTVFAAIEPNTQTAPQEMFSTVDEVSPISCQNF